MNTSGKGSVKKQNDEVIGYFRQCNFGEIEDPDTGLYLNTIYNFFLYKLDIMESFWMLFRNSEKDKKKFSFSQINKRFLF